MNSFASPIQRLSAFIIDYSLIYLFLIILINLMPEFRELTRQHHQNMNDMNLAKRILEYSNRIESYTFIIWIFLCSIMESSKIQGTLGKKIIKIKVINLNGDRISIKTSIVRNLLKFISSIFFFGFVLIAFTKKNQGLHDRLTETFVVNKIEK